MAKMQGEGRVGCQGVDPDTSKENQNKSIERQYYQRKKTLLFADVCVLQIMQPITLIEGHQGGRRKKTCSETTKTLEGQTLD